MKDHTPGRTLPTTGDRESEIVQAAVPVFLRFGYKKTSMEAVATASKLSRQALYLHFPNKEALFCKVVNSLGKITGEKAHAALWRPGLRLDEQLLAAFDETMPSESMELLAELLATAKELVPESVADVDALVVIEVGARLSEALGGHRWPLRGVTLEQVAQVLQATSYGLKEQVDNRDDYLVGMRSAIVLTLTAGGLMPPNNERRRQSGRAQNKGVPQ